MNRIEQSIKHCNSWIRYHHRNAVVWKTSRNPFRDEVVRSETKSMNFFLQLKRWLQDVGTEQ